MDRPPARTTGLVYVAVFVVALLGTQGAAWSSGTPEVGVFEALNVYWGAFAAALLWMAGYLERQAARAFDTLRPSIDLAPEDAAALRWRMVVVPARPAAVLTVVAALSTLAQFVADPAGAGIQGAAEPFVVFYFMVQSFLTAIILQLLYRLVRQMRLIRWLVDEVVPVDIFQPGPVHALATVTSRPVALVALLVAPAPLLIQLPGDLAALLIGWVPFLAGPPIIAGLAFVIPLAGARARLADQKERLLDDVGGRIRRTIDDAHRSTDAGDFGRADAASRTLAQLVTERDILAKLPTWPWSTATLRSFLSATLLPMAVFAAQQVLVRLL
ncbi:MAG: hypothetical protein L0227_04145 [Chloroflexi bacterium]|nr:hypothetical protein [Chloroflexota bacterium]